MLLKANGDCKYVPENDATFKRKKERLKEELKTHKAELKEKQGLLRKQERYMKEQHENLIKLETKCRKLQALINEHKAGIVQPDVEEHKSEEDVNGLRDKLKEEEKKYEEEKKKHRQLIVAHENIVKNLNLELEAVTLQLKQKDHESRVNYLKINELKRLLRTNVRANIYKQPEVNSNIVAMNVEQLKHVMIAEKINIPAKWVEEQRIEEEKSFTTPKVLDIENLNPDLTQAVNNLNATQEKPLSIFSKPLMSIGRKRK
eukprot:TRINITY_DN3445_c0_g2_i2.p1 TRINITY_DN3445_c0_g2~~TRINITY_DN3445_c0_g2_i2.p1  ORF type:complete len:259 (-),score=69.63 TRINITY_DN3445_c0_g2_i2:442-1218(-)